MKKIAAAYIRVSTHMQEELSPDAQLRCIRVWGDAHGYYVPDEYVFIDNGISGRKAKKRHDFLRMIGLAKTKPASPFEAILLWKFNRFARNQEESIDIGCPGLLSVLPAVLLFLRLCNTVMIAPTLIFSATNTLKENAWFLMEFLKRSLFHWF